MIVTDEGGFLEVPIIYKKLMELTETEDDKKSRLHKLNGIVKFFVFASFAVAISGLFMEIARILGVSTTFSKWVGNKSPSSIYFLRLLCLF